MLKQPLIGKHLLFSVVTRIKLRLLGRSQKELLNRVILNIRKEQKSNCNTWGMCNGLKSLAGYETKNNRICWSGLNVNEVNTCLQGLSLIFLLLMI